MSLASMNFGFGDSSKNNSKVETAKEAKKEFNDDSELMHGFGADSEYTKGEKENFAESPHLENELDAMKSFLSSGDNGGQGKERFSASYPAIEFRDDSVLAAKQVMEQKSTKDKKQQPEKIVETAKPSGKHAYKAQEVQKVEDDVKNDAEDSEETTKKNTERTEKFSKHVIVLNDSGTVRYLADYTKFTVNKTKFEHGSLVLAYDKHEKPLMYLLESGGSLMAYRYLQGNLKVSIPASVNGMPVKYLHPQFLRGSLNPFNGVKFQSLKNQFNAENILNADKKSVKASLKGITELILPNTLEMIPPKVFCNCLALKTLVVPASVKVVSVDAFYCSSFSDLYFNGECPKGFRLNTNLPKSVRVHFRKEYSKSFGV